MIDDEGRAGPPRYHERRAASGRELLPALAVGVGAGLAAFYLAQLMLRRAPLRPERTIAILRDDAPVRPRRSRN